MLSGLKGLIKRIPGTRGVAQRLGLSSQGSWLFQREVLGWTSEAGLVQQLPLSHRLFAAYASSFFARRSTRDLWGGRAAFSIAALAQRFTRRNGAMAELKVGEISVVVDLQDPRFLQVVNELSQSADTAFLAEFVREGNTFLDIGANHGAFALVASRLVGSSGYVVAVEPQPHLAEAVRRSLSATALGPFEVHALALGDRSGTIELLIPRSYSGTAGVFAAHSGTHPHRRVEVPLRRCDEELDWRKFPGSLFIKLDVEGSEYAFLRGAQEMIRSRRPILLMEINAGAMRAASTSPDEFRVQLQELGFTDYADLGAPEIRLSLADLDLTSQESRNVLLFPSE